MSKFKRHSFVAIAVLVMGAAGTILLSPGPKLSMRGMLPLEDGGALVVAQREAPGQEGHLVRLSAEGEVMWDHGFDAMIPSHDPNFGVAISKENVFTRPGAFTAWMGGVVLNLSDGTVTAERWVPWSDGWHFWTQADWLDETTLFTSASAGRRMRMQVTRPRTGEVVWQHHTDARGFDGKRSVGGVLYQKTFSNWHLVAMDSGLVTPVGFESGALCVRGAEVFGVSGGKLYRAKPGHAPRAVAMTLPQDLHVWTCGWRGEDLVVVGTDHRESRVGASVIARVRTDGSVVWSRRWKQTSRRAAFFHGPSPDRWQPTSGKVARSVPVILTRHGGDKIRSRLVMLDMETGQTRWETKEHDSLSVELLRSPPGLHYAAGNDRVVVLDGETGAIVGAARGPMSQLRPEQFAGESVWLFSSGMHPADKLPWVSVDHKTLKVQKRGHPTIPEIVEDIAGAAQWLGIPDTVDRP